MNSTEYYRKNKDARERKKIYDSQLNKRKEQIKKRVESNRKRRQAIAKGINVTGKDYDHKTNRFVSIKTNRGRKNEGGR